MKGLNSSVSLNTANARIARAFRHALAKGTRPDSFGIMGSPGIGKTTSIGAMAAANNWGFVSIPMGNKEPPDVQGLMSLDPSDPRYFIYRAPDWAKGKLKGSCDRPWVVLLDDFPHATKQVQAGALKLIHEHQFGDTTQLDNKVLFVLSGNRLEDNAGAGPVLSPVRSRIRRFDCYADVKEWLDRCGDWGIHFGVRAWLKQQSQFFAPDPTKSKSFSYPCPRSHQMLSNAQHEADGVGERLTLEEAAGIVGDEAAAQYIQFYKAKDHMVDPELVLADPEHVEVSTKNLDAFFMLVKALESRIETDPAKTWSPILKFSLRKDLGRGDIMAELGEYSVLRAINKTPDHKLHTKILESGEFKAFEKCFSSSMLQVTELAKQLGRE